MRHTKGTPSVRIKKLTALVLSAAVAFSVPVMHAFADVQEAENFQEVMVESDAGAERPAQEQNADKTAENTETGNEETADGANADEVVSQDGDETDTASGAAQGTDPSADDSSAETDAEEPAAVVASIGQHTYSSLREAVAAAQAGDRVCLHQDAVESVMIKKDMTLDLQGHSVTGSSSYAICVNGATAVIVNGALKDTTAKNGAGLYAYHADVTMQNVVISGNTATGGYGGGIYAAGSNLTMEDCTVSDNVSAYYGSGISLGSESRLEGSNLKIARNVFTRNDSYACGGGIYAADADSSILLKDSVLTQNEACNGGGIYSYGAVTLQNCTLSENKAEYAGGGIYSEGSYGGTGVIMTGGTLENNRAEGNGGGLYMTSTGLTMRDAAVTGNYARNTGGGLYLSPDADTAVTNTRFTGNSGETGSAVSSRGSSNREGDPTQFENCTFVQNTASEDGSIFSGGTKNRMKNCRFTENTSDGVIVDYYGMRSELLMESCLLEKNRSAFATVCNGCSSAANGVELRDTVIRQNTATASDPTATGGIAATDSGYLRMTSGAVYDNISMADTGANDLYLSARSKVTVLKAVDMQDGVQDFSGYTWHDDVNDINEKDALTSDENSSRYFSVGRYDDRVIAQVGEATFTSLQAALEAAKTGDTIVIVAAQTDGNSNVTVKPAEITKAVTIDLNGHTMWVRGGSGLCATDGMLRLCGNGTVLGTVRVNGQGRVEIADHVTVEHLVVNGKDACLNMESETVHLTFGAGKSVELGEHFTAQKIEVTLADQVLAQLNSADFLKENITLFTGCTEEDIVTKITVKGIRNPLVQIVLKDGKVQIEKKALQGIFLDGKAGKDSADGLSKETPVRSFAKAKALLAEHPALDTIYIMGTVTVRGEDTWSLAGGKVMRYPEYAGTLISADSGSALHLEHIIIDGASSYKVTGVKSLISVRGSLEIGTGAVLQNNDVSSASGAAARGGAVLCDGLLSMNGGVIRNCGAVHGGGVFLYGSGLFTMQDGVLEENVAKSIREKGQGGAVMITHNAKMVMDGGVLRGNRSEKGSGGAISVGGLAEKAACPKLEINGGCIEKNDAYTCGGGIYVECNSVAVINAQGKRGNLIQIRKNACHGKGGGGWFGGGGIYVNGGLNRHPVFRENGKLYLYNAAVYGNTAQGCEGEYGAGFAGCGTSDTRFYLTDGGVFYGNYGSGGNRSDILCSNIDHDSGVPGLGTSPKNDISPYMLGGGAYHWRDDNDTEVSLNSVQKSGVHSLHTNLTTEDQEIETAMSLAGVFITENTSDRRGGGIGSNGDVIIGRPDDEKELCAIRAKKVWEDEDDAKQLRPTVLKIWLVRNGEKVTFQYMRPDENGVWQEVVFDRQPVADEAGTSYTYTVFEDREGLDSHYVSSVEKVDGVWVITNTYEEKPPKTPVIPNPPEPEEPPTDIEEPDVPLGPGPEPEEPPIDIDEPDVPLGPGPGTDAPIPTPDDEGDPNQPPTGDTAPILALLGLMVLSAVGIACTAGRLKKRQ